MATRIQLRRDTAAQWTANNPTLATGEAGYETDTGRLKIGNGSTAWSSLSYVQVALGTDTTGNYVATISGTSNQISVSGSGSESATVTLSLPQDIDTASSPTFAGATIDAIRVGVTGSNEIDTASGNLTIDSAGGTVTVDDNLVVSGNLTVSGTTTTVNTEEINLADNIIVLNANATGSPTENAGIEVERGDSTNVVLRWNESTDTWEATRNGTDYYALVLAGDDIATSDITNFTEDVQDVVGGMISSNTESGIAVTYDDANGKLNFDVNDPTITLSGDVTGSGTITDLGNVTITTTIAADSVALGTDTTGNYVATVSGTDGVSVSGSGSETSAVTIANTDKGSSQNIFKNFAVSGQSNIVADTNDDTLTFAGGTGITLTTDATTDTLTVTNSGVTSLTGTANQVSVSSSSGSITISVPQDINTTSSPTFAGATIDAIRIGITAENEIDTTSGNLTIDSSGGTVTVDDNLVVSGDFTVNGTTTTINATTLVVDDKNIELGSVETPTDTTADGGGITLKGATDKTFNWVDSTDSWTSSEHIDLANGKVIKINGTEVLSSTQYTGNAATVTNGVVTTGSYSDPSWLSISKSFVGLGNVENTALSTWSGSSNITTVGTISSGTWEATDVALAHGGTNASLTAVNGGVVYSTNSAMAITSAGSAGQVLTSNGASAPTWQTPSSGGFDAFLLAGM